MVRSERITYMNGDFIPESEAKVHFRDRSFKYGDGVFDMTRTFGHKIFKIEEHVERLYKSLNYLDIKLDLPPKKMVEISKEVLQRNLPLIKKDEDYWVGQRISRGVDRVGGEQWDLEGGPTVIVECAPLPLKPRASLYEAGIKVWTPSTRRTPFQSMSPRAKTHNYINLILGDNEVKRIDKDAWAILLDLEGNLTEGMGSNIFTVSNGNIYTPKTQNVLGGISRETVIDLAKSKKIKINERKISPDELSSFVGCFITGTAAEITPVASILNNKYKVCDTILDLSKSYENLVGKILITNTDL